jgi:hypothetical protein
MRAVRCSRSVTSALQLVVIVRRIVHADADTDNRTADQYRYDGFLHGFLFAVNGETPTNCHSIWSVCRSLMLRFHLEM